MNRKLKILFGSSEVYPFSKTGGLADVSSALPQVLRTMGHDVRIVTPKYKCVDRFQKELKELDQQIVIPVGEEQIKGTLVEGKLHRTIPIYFVNNKEYFHRDELYGTDNENYPDNAARFIFFSRATIELCKKIHFQPDIIHCNDWQTGLVPVYLKTLYHSDPMFRDTRTLLTLHNVAYQGNFWHLDLPLAHLPWSLFNPEGVELYGKFNFLKTGSVFADLLTTVSQTYSQEICTPEYGFGLDGLFRHRAAELYGILNGVDYQEWNPLLDPWIKKSYGAHNLLGKGTCRQSLVRKFSLAIGKNTPIFCCISRFSYQKGIDLLVKGIQAMVDEDVAFVILGTGDAQYEEELSYLSKSYPEKIACRIGFDEGLAHQILAGSDSVVLPSRYEPCGLTQMYGLKYGTVPLVRAVGGLEDTVREFEPDLEQCEGTGFKFHKFDLENFLQAMKKARMVFRNREQWQELMIHGMKEDFSWERAAEKYVRLYLKELSK